MVNIVTQLRISRDLKESSIIEEIKIIELILKESLVKEKTQTFSNKGTQSQESVFYR